MRDSIELLSADMEDALINIRLELMCCDNIALGGASVFEVVSHAKLSIEQNVQDALQELNAVLSVELSNNNYPHHYKHQLEELRQCVKRSNRLH